MKREDIKIEQQDIFHDLLSQMDYERFNESWNFLNLWMWWKPYNIKAVFGDNMIACVMPTESNEWFLRPICSKDNVAKWFEFAKEIAGTDSIVVHNAHDELIDAFKAKGLKVEIKERLIEMDEYFYEAEKLRTFAGKKLQKKRNLMNRFKKDYEGRWAYKTLGNDDIVEVQAYLEDWKGRNIKDSEYFNIEMDMVEAALKDFSQFKNIKMGGIFIDDQLKGFSIAEAVSKDFINVNIEKADSEITGLYQVLVSEFLKNEVPDVVYLSREDAADDDGLKHSKLSYRPVKVVEKYDIIITN